MVSSANLCQPATRLYRSKLLHICWRYSQIRTSCNGGGSLKDVLAKIIPKERQNMLGLLCLYGDTKLGEITVKNVLGGMRGMPLLICDTSALDAKKGISYRGIPIKDVFTKLPPAKGTKMVSPEAVFWLLTTGKIPKPEQVKLITKEWNKRGKLPEYAIKLLDSMDKSVHPMAQLVAASACLNKDSHFVKAYSKGVPKAKYWEYIYEDAMDLCARVISVAAIIYTNVFKGGAGCRELNTDLDWSGNFCRMMGNNDKDFVDLMRMYFIIHADHDSGNVSAHTTHLVGSALSDPYLSYAAGMCGLAGPLHGLANQEVLVWLNDLKKAIGDNPTDEQIVKFINDGLAKGKVVPGYGHAVMRHVDPRFVLQHEFGMKYCKDDVNVKLVTRLWKIIPDVLKALGKVANPNPNVDAHSGVLLQHYGLKEMQYYTVLFAVSRTLGVMSQLIWSRALGAPIERPLALSSESLCRLLSSEE